MIACAVAAIASAAANPDSAEDQYVHVWRGEGLNAWKNANMSRNVRVEDGMLKLGSTGWDSFITGPAIDLAPKADQEVVFTAKVSVGGRGQLFWSRPQDPAPLERFAREFEWIADGRFHTYRVRPYWQGAGKVVRLRLDFPAEGGTNGEWELSAIGIRTNPDYRKPGNVVDADRYVGVTFDCTWTNRTAWADLRWVSDSAPGFTPVPRHFRVFGDGRKHTYFINCMIAGTWNGNYMEPPPGSWKGHVSDFGILDWRTKREFPIENLRFVEVEPDLPPDLVVIHTRQPNLLDRAGRAVPLEFCVKNLGVQTARGLRCDVEGLPEGVKVLDHASAAQMRDVAGGESRLHRVEIVAEKPISFAARLKLSGPGLAEPFVVEIPVKIAPSLGLAAADYPPPPKPLKGPYEIGAYYFCDWVRTEQWAKLWHTTPERRPANGWYDNRKSEVLDWQIKWSVENGISFFLVDWYWTKGRHGVDYWEQALAGARYKDSIKWAVMWANHTAPGSHSFEDQAKVTKFWIDNFFGMGNYYFIDGMPVVCIWAPEHFDRDVGKGRGVEVLELSKRMAREAGYKGIYFMCMKFPEGDSTAKPVQRCKDLGFDMTTIYHYIESGPNAKTIPPGIREFADVASSSYGYWTARHKTGILPEMYNIATGWDDRPWNHGLEVRGKNVEDMRRICRDARRFADETGARRFVLAPVNEWGEGSYAEPNSEFGFGMYEAVRDAFFEKPAEGWPVNAIAADYGLGAERYELPHDASLVTATSWDFRGGKNETVRSLLGWHKLMGFGEIRAKSDGLGLVSTTDDPAIQIRTQVAASEFRELVVRMKVAPGAKGPVRLFWADSSDRTDEIARETLPLVEDGAFHDYAFQVGTNARWRGVVRRIRFDPVESEGADVTVASIALRRGLAAAETQGVIFTYAGDRIAWADLSWVSSERPDRVRVTRGVRLFGDGMRHTYYVDLANARTTTGTGQKVPPGQPWRGRITDFALLEMHTGARLPIGDVRFVAEEPDLPPDLVALAETRAAELNRAGQPVPLDVSLRNLGTLTATGLVCTVSGLPEGVRLRNPAAARRVVPILGGEAMVHRVELESDRPVSFTASVEVQGGVRPVRRDIPVRIGPSLGLAAADYPPPPKPLKGPYEIGALYFPAWRTTAYWEYVWGISPERRPAVGWADYGNPEVVDWHIKWAVENGISFFLVDWYWVKGSHGNSAWEEALPKARYRNAIKWALMWANHTPKGTHSLEDQRKVTQFWIDNFFREENYYRIDGRPVVCIWDGGNLDRDMGGRLGDGRQLLALSDRMAREAGLKGIFFMCMKHPEGDFSPESARSCQARGYEMTTLYHYMGDGGRPHDADCRWRFPFDYVAESSYAHWKARRATHDILPDIPNISTGWNDLPWNDGCEIYGKSVELFRRICRDARRFADETGERRFLLAPLNEWGEGSYAEPCAEFGFGFYEAVREAFFEKPAEGWPLNCTPRDIGRPCDAYEVPLHQSGGTATASEWDFRGGMACGWQNQMGIASFRGTPEGLALACSDKDPAIYLRVHLVARDWSKAVVRMRVPADAQGPVRLFWADRSCQTQTPVQANVPVKTDGRLHEYGFDLAANPHWKGRIGLLRFDPCESTGDVLVESIRLLK